MQREKNNRAERTQIKSTQRHRQRAEVYAINAYLKSMEQQRYEEMMRSKYHPSSGGGGGGGGGASRIEPLTYDSDSSLSHDSEDSSDPPHKSDQQSRSRKTRQPPPSSPKGTVPNPSRSYGV